MVTKTVKRKFYRYLTFRHAWVIKCYTREEANCLKGLQYIDLKLIE